MGTTPKVTVIGLGKMGGSVAKHLKSLGWQVHGYDPFPAARDTAAKNGIKVHENISEAVSDSHTIYTSLPSEQALREALSPESPIWKTIPEDALIIEMSTVSPELIKEIATSTPKAVTVADAAVSGGPKEAGSGELGIFLGIDKELDQNQRSFLEAISNLIHEVGGIGAGKVMKIINNAISMTNAAIAAEAISLGMRAGIELETLYETLSKSGADSRQLRSRFPRAVAGDFDPGAAIRIVRKDLELAQSFSHSVDGQTPIIDTANALFEVAEKAGLSEKDPVALIQLFTSDEKSTRKLIEEI